MAHKKKGRAALERRQGVAAFAVARRVRKVDAQLAALKGNTHQKAYLNNERLRHIDELNRIANNIFADGGYRAKEYVETLLDKMYMPKRKQ